MDLLFDDKQKTMHCDSCGRETLSKCYLKECKCCLPDHQRLFWEKSIVEDIIIEKSSDEAGEWLNQ